MFFFIYSTVIVLRYIIVFHHNFQSLILKLVLTTLRAGKCAVLTFFLFFLCCNSLMKVESTTLPVESISFKQDRHEKAAFMP